MGLCVAVRRAEAEAGGCSCFQGWRGWRRQGVNARDFDPGMRKRNYRLSGSGAEDDGLFLNCFLPKKDPGSPTLRALESFRASKYVCTYVLDLLRSGTAIWKVETDTTLATRPELRYCSLPILDVTKNSAFETRHGERLRRFCAFVVRLELWCCGPMDV
jgi:hypothetical protein